MLPDGLFSGQLALIFRLRWLALSHRYGRGPGKKKKKHGNLKKLVFLLSACALLLAQNAWWNETVLR
jgi:hypothetical protein